MIHMYVITIKRVKHYVCTWFFCCHLPINYHQLFFIFLGHCATQIRLIMLVVLILKIHQKQIRKIWTIPKTEFVTTLLWSTIKEKKIKKKSKNFIKWNWLYSSKLIRVYWQNLNSKKKLKLLKIIFSTPTIITSMIKHFKNIY